MWGFIKKLFRKRPPAPVSELRRPTMHWIPNGYAIAFCQVEEPALYTFDVESLQKVSNACPTCRDRGLLAYRRHVLTTR